MTQTRLFISMSCLKKNPEDMCSVAGPGLHDAINSGSMDLSSFLLPHGPRELVKFQLDSITAS